MTGTRSVSRNRDALIAAAKVYVEAPPIPAELSLEMTSACNQACLFCPNRKQTRVAPTMPLADARRWLSEAHGLGVRRVGLHAKGEPFLVRKLEDYIAAARDAGFDDIFLTSNGAGATPERLARAVAAGLSSLKFSINGYGREQYLRVHGEDHWDRVMHHLEAAISLRGPSFSIYISCVETAQAPDAAARLRADFGMRVDEVVSYACSNFCGYLHSDTLKMVVPERHRPCNLPFAKLHITPEGYLSGCCGDYENHLAVADLRHASIADAWVSEPFRELRRRHIEDRLAGLICDACMNGGASRETVAPLVARLASPLPEGYWSTDDVASLIATRNIRWAKKQP